MTPILTNAGTGDVQLLESHVEQVATPLSCGSVGPIFAIGLSMDGEPQQISFKLADNTEVNEQAPSGTLLDTTNEMLREVDLWDRASDRDFFDFESSLG